MATSTESVVIESISHGTIAEPHAAVYKMHRYFARRPGNVFRFLVQHYTREGDLVLDPFCGGGVTVIEALRLRRRVVGVDLNPMATFITECETMTLDPRDIRTEFDRMVKAVGQKIDNLYVARCPKCSSHARALWVEWAYLFDCPKCGHKVAADEKRKGRKYICPSCKTKFGTARVPKTGEKPVRLLVECESCEFKGERLAEPEDQEVADKAARELQELSKSGEIWFPSDELPAGNLEAENSLHAKGFTHFSKFYTPRNLLALALLKKRVDQVRDPQLSKILHLVFSSTVDYSTTLSRVVDGAGREITTHAFWPPDTPAENNVWFAFGKRVAAAVAGKKWTQGELGHVTYTTKWKAENESDAVLLTQSSTSLPLAEASVDAVITDPPYGGNVNYLELSNLWTVWIRDVLGLREGTLDRRDEAIMDRRQFAGAKTIEHYERVLRTILRECWRVLKPNGWLVMTFHNRQLTVWNSLLAAAHDAGFVFPDKNGVIYQPPIRAYTTTLHQRRSGSMLGDFILSFRKGERPEEFGGLGEREVEEKVVSQVQGVIRFHGGASIGTIYMQLIPFLTNEGLLHRVGQKDLEPILHHHFVKKGEKWYFGEHLDEKGNIRPFDFVPAEFRIEQLIRSILRERKKATLDEIYQGLYTNLVNGMTPESEEITSVLHRIARRTRTENVKREVWELKSQVTLGRWEAAGERAVSSEEHNEIILMLATRGNFLGYAVHVGEREMSQDSRLKEISTPMADPLQFGLSADAFRIVRQIDLLWIRGNAIVAAFEVEKSTTIDSGINRFRNLFAALPNLNVPAFIVVPEGRLAEAQRKIESPANRRERLHERISVLAFSAVPGIGAEILGS